MINRKLLALISMKTLLVACASTPTQIVKVDQIDFKGDSGARITSSDHLNRNYSNLSEGEAVVIAISSDRAGAISQPDNVTVSITEVIAENEEKSLELLRTRCDVDSDGIWDNYCPELLSEILDSNSERTVMLETGYQVSSVTYGRDDWGGSTTFDRGDVTGQSKPIYVRMLSVNKGNKEFNGDLDIIVNIPPQVEFKQIKELYKVSSLANAKAIVGGIVGAARLLSGDPYAAYRNPEDEVSWIKDYNRIESFTNFNNSTEGRTLKVKAKDIQLKPNQGVELIYEVSYEFPG